jgi:hypothetical protein
MMMMMMMMMIIIIIIIIQLECRGVVLGTAAVKAGIRGKRILC